AIIAPSASPLRIEILGSVRDRLRPRDKCIPCRLRRAVRVTKSERAEPCDEVVIVGHSVVLPVRAALLGYQVMHLEKAQQWDTRRRVCPRAVHIADELCLCSLAAAEPRRRCEADFCKEHGPAAGPGENRRKIRERSGWLRELEISARRIVRHDRDVV